MEIQLLVIGKNSSGVLEEATHMYLKRLKHYIPYTFKVLPDVKNTKAMSEQQQKAAEGKLLLGALQSSDFVMLLDERGKRFSSIAFADWLQVKMLSGLKRLVFVVGGPYGFSPEVYERADSMLSLSDMTFSHEMIRLFFTEQVYRAMTILRREPYHHE
ncbi:MAG: 23S rRNA (pseudouridine(1915)-N(3))-methyltransferase RlmH [Prevotella sp.]|nr:23S rRNA (pseudouridine(1915)-N(3))-methyltransferase RlmH [Prevotella sp.]MCM1075249.1 23S rRNA (pseudouridine(1915)-N(3))-methyltransferase RlmH [Ruminococcus sp.]